jgi:hypothetical protein
VAGSLHRHQKGPASDHHGEAVRPYGRIRRPPGAPRAGPEAQPSALPETGAKPSDRRDHSYGGTGRPFPFLTEERAERALKFALIAGTILLVVLVGAAMLDSLLKQAPAGSGPGTAAAPVTTSTPVRATAQAVTAAATAPKTLPPAMTAGTLSPYSVDPDQFIPDPHATRYVAPGYRVIDGAGTPSPTSTGSGAIVIYETPHTIITGTSSGAGTQVIVTPLPPTAEPVTSAVTTASQTTQPTPGSTTVRTATTATPTTSTPAPTKTTAKPTGTTVPSTVTTAPPTTAASSTTVPVPVTLTSTPSATPVPTPVPSIPAPTPSPSITTTKSLSMTAETTIPSPPLLPAVTAR